MKTPMINIQFRKIKIIFLNLFIPFSLYSQAGYFDNNPVWTIFSGCAVGYPCIEYKNYNYYINGDTIINGHTYKKMFQRGDGWFFWADPSPVPISCQTSPYTFNDTISPYAYVRDTLNKIYFTSFGNPDTLLYDFNLIVGDTLPLSYLINASYTVTVTAIDSIVVGNSYRKRFELSSGSYHLIEGIGHDFGIFEPLGIGFDCGYNLSCYSSNDTTYYPSLNSSSCDINVGISSIDIMQSNVYPNPANSFITITNSHPIITIDILNLIQQSIMSVNGNGEQKLEVDITKLNPGIYFLKISSNSPQQFEVKKILKI